MVYDYSTAGTAANAGFGLGCNGTAAGYSPRAFRAIPLSKVNEPTRLMFISPAFAQAADAGASTGALIANLIPFVAIIAIMYFLVIRPQQQRLKAQQAMIAGVKRGDIVVTGGGIIGKVVKVMEGDEVLVEIAEEVRIKVLKSTIADIRSKTEPSENKPAETK
jgi:preprotein translocase subunit YajC